VVLRKSKLYKPAFDNFQEALKRDPANWEIHNNLGNLFAEIRDYPQAIQAFQKTLSLNPNEADIYFNFGLIYFAQNDFNQAQELFKKALTINSQHLLAKEYWEKSQTAEKQK
jgi:tetratricopeptide (TPR) repeat protein